MDGFPIGLTSVLSGATRSQLQRWKRKGLIVPEVRPKRPPLWSLRDIVALRAIACLRAETSLQQISRAFQTLDLLHLQEHPAAYTFGTDGTTIFVQDPHSDKAIDLNRSIGSRTLFTFQEISTSFKNLHGQTVSPLHPPAPHISVDFGRIEGWPTIENTRVPFDTIANLVDGTTITVDDVEYYYPNVDAEAARGALQLQKLIEAA